MQAFVPVLATIVGGLIAAGAGLLGGWAGHRWAMAERSAERAEVRRVALLDQRAADLRELGGMLPEMLAAAQEIIWERTTMPTGKEMPRSDPRAMRLTNLGQKSRFLRVVVGDKELGELVGKVWRTTERLSDAAQDQVDERMHAANQAVAGALDKVGELLRAAETPQQSLPTATTGMLDKPKTG